MTMYASQAINTDPTPFVISYQGVYGKRVAADYAAQLPSRYENGFGEIVTVRNEPRPRFDNNPNPILEMIRTEEYEPGPCLEYIERGGSDWPAAITPDHIEHARKVLTRLAAFAKNEESR